MNADTSKLYVFGNKSVWNTGGCATLLVLLSGVAQAQLTIPGNNGQDGAFEPSASVEIDLSLAVTGQWDTTNSTGQGVYDPEQWAVIFRYTSVNIASGKTVTFKNHPSRAPVIWLVQGDVTIAGTLSLDGATGHGISPTATNFSEPGPGGFRGGRGLRPSVLGAAGMGPGGGGFSSTGSVGSSGSYSTVGSLGNGGASAGALYGNEGLFPLVGGSGGAGRPSNDGGGGGAGGGAILIATSGAINLSGTMQARGGVPGGPNGGGGSGGGIRMIADSVGGNGVLSVGGYLGGGLGRIRTEANTITLTVALAHSTGLPTVPPRIFREASDGVPTITSMVLDGEPVPEDPLSFPTADVTLLDVDGEDTVILAITAEHVPAGSTVKARVVRISGVEEIITAVFDGTSGDETYWNAEIPVAGGFSTIQVHAVLP